MDAKFSNKTKNMIKTVQNLFRYISFKALTGLWTTDRAATNKMTILFNKLPWFRYLFSSLKNGQVFRLLASSLAFNNSMKLSAENSEEINFVARNLK